MTARETLRTLGTVTPITRARTRPVNRCSRFSTARSRLQALRPCFGSPAHVEAFRECMKAAVAERENVVLLSEWRRVGRRG